MSKKREEQRRADLDRRLLGILIDSPRRVLSIAIATGIAIAHALYRRRERKLVDRMAYDEAFCFAAVEGVLEMWSAASRAGQLTEPQFDAMIDRIIMMSRAS